MYQALDCYRLTVHAWAADYPDRSVRLQVSLANRAAVIIVILANNRTEIGAALPAPNEAERGNLRLDLRCIDRIREPADGLAYGACGVFAGVTTPM